MYETSPIVVHIPHSSTAIPREYRHIYLEPEKLDQLILALTDLYTDELFAGAAWTIVFPVSRFLCDVERFRDKGQEKMTKRGMWICYTHTPFAQPLATFGPAHEEHILKTYYDVHHREFTAMVQRKLASVGCVFIIDGHSFPEHLPYYPAGACPDFCIGSDPYHTPGYLVNACREFLAFRGYSTAENHPFSGAIVPMKYYGKDPRVQSLMIEVNRRLYCDKNGRKNAAFPVVQKDLQDLLAYLGTVFNL